MVDYNIPIAGYSVFMKWAQLVIDTGFSAKSSKGYAATVSKMRKSVDMEHN